ncbi:MAG TPA: ATP-binding protein [Pseudolabrys sp.]|nr:ATP-binding protein [Pseudolabrys sp.]
MTLEKIEPVKIHILIVDDDAGDRKALRRALEGSGTAGDIVEAVDIESALAACDSRAFDFAIVDYRMPGQDGLHGVTALHARFPFMPIVMATSHGDEVIAAEALKRGAADYIPKANIRAQSIRRVLDSAMEKATLRRELARRQEELEKFAAVLVHDLRAPITAIRAFARYIDKGLQAETPDRETIAGQCRQIVECGRRMDALITALYEYTKADAEVGFDVVDMRSALAEARSNLEAIIERQHARVEHGPLPTVLGNLPQLSELLQNLIGNGLKYCEMPAPVIEIHAQPEPDNVWRFAVRDNGIGIAEKNRRRIFEPFERLHGTGKYEGSGLGLAICKKIVERHGGAIWCEGNEGPGSTFVFTLRGAPGY